MRVRGPGRSMLVALAVAGLACQAAPTKVADAVVIGATLPLTGADAKKASAMKRGYERAVAGANAKGGVRIGEATLPVRLELRDDTADAATLEALVHALVDAGVHVILATPQDVRAAAEADVTEKAGIPLVGNPVDHAGLPGKRMTWMVLVPATSADAETRAHEVATATLDAIATAGHLEPRRIRDTLLLAPQGNRGVGARGPGV